MCYFIYKIHFNKHQQTSYITISFIGSSNPIIDNQQNLFLNAMSQGGVQSKKEEFKKYLEKTGAVDQLTKILVQLYEEPEKPGNAVDYLKRMLGGGGEVDGNKLKREYEEAKLENQRLKKQIKDTKQQIEKRKNL